jgi:proteasome lid subunit RPN8/RPN11
LSPVHLPADAIAAMLAHSATCAPEECCGLIAIGDDGEIRFVYPLANADRSTTSFTIDPDDSYGAFMHADRNGWSIGGVFHSHPTGPDFLSERDILETADPGWFHILVCPDGLRAFRIEAGEADEIPILGF